jgi:predicted nuclease of predicted toxin-antitoxin system
MRFLADESCDFRVARALRAAGHDVLAVAEVAPGADDKIIIELSLHERRVFITEDRDFGHLVYASDMQTSGVILLRFPANARAILPDVVVELVTEHGDKLKDHFVVVQPGRIRFGVTRRR